MAYRVPCLETNLGMTDRAVRFGIGAGCIAVASLLKRRPGTSAVVGALAGTQFWEALTGYCVFYALMDWTTVAGEAPPRRLRVRRALGLRA